jgi:hypothetical protein
MECDSRRGFGLDIGLFDHLYTPLGTTSNYSAISSQPPLQNSTELITPTLLVIIPRHGPHRKHRSSIVSCLFIAVGTCLPGRFRETVAVYSPYLAVVA